MRRTPIRIIAVVMATMLFYSPGLAAARDVSPGASPATVPATPVGEQLTWVLAALEDGAQRLTPEDVTAHFAPAFLGLVPAEQLVQLTQQLALGLGSFTFEGFTRPPTDTQANALLISADGTPWAVPIDVEAAPPHLITGLNFAPVPTPPGVTLSPYAGPDGAPVAGPERIDGLYDVGEGRQLYLSCVGTGSPTVVLESGLGDPAAPWFGIESAVIQTKRVCSYDRAGSAGGASEPAKEPRTGEDAVADLHALLGAADVPGPYVLVGHSIGGLFVRLYAHTYPDEVVGLVPVDASHEEQDVRLEQLVGPELWEQLQQRITQAPNPEGMDFAATADQVRAARSEAPLPSMPLVVVTAGQPEDPALFPPDWPVAEDAALWKEIQADLANLVPGGEQVVAERSGHYVHQTQPELVVEAIQKVIAAVQGPTTGATPVAGTYPLTPDPADCRVEPRSLDSVIAAVGTPAANMPAAAASPTPFVRPHGEPADAATTAAVTATVQEVFACANAGDFLRIFAFYTDDYLRVFLAGTPLSEEVLALLTATPMPLPEAELRTIIRIDAVEILPDGRVGAIVVLDEPSDPRTEEPDYIFLERIGDRWLVDEVVEDGGMPATPMVTPAT